MSNLDSFHPFRQTVNLKDDSSKDNNSDSSKSSDGKNKDDIQYVPWLSWKTKFRLLIGILAFIAISLIGSSVYDSLSPLLSPFGEHGTNTSQISQPVGMGEESVPLVFDKNDLNERGREVGYARKKAGFFASIFCKGGKKSSFCD